MATQTFLKLPLVKQRTGIFRSEIYKESMLVLIDETGCPGFKLAKGSTPYFIIAIIIFKDFIEAEKASQSIQTPVRSIKLNNY